MAYESKIDAELELALKYYQTSIGTAFTANTGVSLEGDWEIIVKYHGDILIPVQTVGAKVEILNESFASIVIKPSKVEEFASFFQIEYLEFPRRMFYILRESYGKACITNMYNPLLYNLRGRGVLLGIIDSGIDYINPDFRNEDGSTRIAYLWDQTIDGRPPIGFDLGTEYTKEQINEALMQPTIEETLALVPSIDEVGHGTAVSGVAGGNGRGSEGREVGVAPGAEFIVVKVGMESEDSFPRTLEVMRAIKYVIEKATELDRPIAVNIGFGMVQGGHDGRTLLEIFIDQMAARWKSIIIVGTGNQGNQATHTQGILRQDEEKEIQFVINSNQEFYAFNLWKSFIDTFEIKITAPTGEATDRVTIFSNNTLYSVGKTNVFINFSEPSNINPDQQILVYMESQDGSIDAGIWTLTIYGVSIVDGRYNIWGATKEVTGDQTIFLQPSSDITLTIPSTGNAIISVAAFNPFSNQITASSGRGFTRDGRVKPGLAAPGAQVITTDNQGGYSPATGTSIASAFVTGGAALLMEWGITNGNAPFLYGDILRTALLRNTRRLVTDMVYPNPMWGYGAFCLEDTLISLINK
ncbi:MAG TPA: S8 family peptidase [Epulopiscium sp.]|nr:S8 family peptidase [Candidatus Epulonipiscium sp.]